MRDFIKKIIPASIFQILNIPYQRIKKCFRSLSWLMTEYKSRLKWHSTREIDEYRKTIKVYDAFNFFNELDLLEIRLGILDKYVDYFVIVESTKTFSGKQKPLYYKENKERYKKWEHKIIHYIVNDTPEDQAELRGRLTRENNIGSLERQIICHSLTSSNVGSESTTWLREFYQKEVVKRALVGLNDNDICYISDLDEIWNPKLRIDYSLDDVFKLRQTGYIYYLNNRTNEIDWDSWTGTIMTKYKNIKYNCLNHLRTHRKMKDQYVFLRNGGWHFGFQGGLEGAQRKLNEYDHFWYEASETLPKLKDRIEKNIHYRGNVKIKIKVDEHNLPDYILSNREKYSKLFK